jgi:hypothetical protein
MGVTLSLVWLTLRDRHPGARGQRPHQPRPGRHRGGVIDPAPGRDQIPARRETIASTDR